MIIKPINLTRSDFEDYGEILSEVSDKPPWTQDEIITYWGKTAKILFAQNASTGILWGHKRAMSTNQMERHIKTPEILVALKNDAIICVAKPQDTPQKIKAFYINQGQAIVLNTGTWHWTPFATNSDKCEFLVIFQAGTEENDLEIKQLDDTVLIEF